MTSRTEPGMHDSDRLPWLESVEEPVGRGLPWLRILVVLLVLGVFVAGGIGAYVWMQREDAVSGNGARIKAPEGPYKVRPDTPGGLEVEGKGDAVFVVSQGEEQGGGVAMDRAPETPIVAATPTTGTGQGHGGGASSVAVRVPDRVGQLEARAPRPVAVPSVSGNSTAAGGASIVQIGAYPTEDGAVRAWDRFQRRHTFLAGLGRSIAPAERDGTTVYRLRVNAGSAEQAQALCTQLRAAGENCYVAH